MPVIIVGAGPTGLTLAGLLARYGLEVFVIERNPQTVQEPRAVSIDDELLRTMQSVGVIDQLVPNLVLGYGSEDSSSGGRRFLKVKPTTLEYGYPRRKPSLPATRSRGASARKPGAPSQCHDMVRGGTGCILAIGCKRNAAGSQGRCDG